MKNKISIYLNMVIICLSLCVIMVGVYSLTSANLTISGSLGYVYHEKSPYTVTATIQNHTQTAGGNMGSVANLKIQDPVDVTTDNLWQKTKITLPDTMSTVYFHGKGYEAEYIEILVTVENKQDTQKAVVFLFDDIPGLGYTRKVANGAVTTPTSITTNHSAAIILSKSAKTTFRLTLKQSIKKTNLAITQSALNIQLSVADYVASNFTASQTDTTTTTNVTYTLNSAKTAWSITKLASGTTSVEFAPLISGLPVTTLANKSFDEMDSLRTMIIPNSLTDNEVKGSCWECMTTTITLPGSVVNCGIWCYDTMTSTKLLGNGIYNFESISGSAFGRMSDIGYLELQSDKLTEIPLKAFFHTSATELIIPKNVTSVGDQACAFEYAQTITFTGTTPPTFGNNVFYSCPSLTHIYVPSGSVDTYKEALSGQSWGYDKENASDLVTAMPDNFDE